MEGTQVLDTNPTTVPWFAQRIGQVAAEPSSLMIALRSEEDREAVQRIVAPCRWKTYRAVNCEETIRFARYARPRVVICDEELQDGGWRRIWKALSIGPQPPLLIVASRNADERLWSEVLNAGGYDVLLKPFRAEEVAWAIHGAAAHRQCGICRPDSANPS